jgi:bifunctional DNA-binding transcriptional regulator/antitoxin component of YhaV-PrlF toxin-antitoxin module
MTWTIPVEEDENGELFLTFPEDLLQESGLEPGDDVEWIDNNDGSFTLKKLN